jgi:hypothetical protein
MKYKSKNINHLKAISSVTAFNWIRGGTGQSKRQVLKRVQ